MIINGEEIVGWIKLWYNRISLDQLAISTKLGFFSITSFLL